MPDPVRPVATLNAPWWRLLNRYHWYVFMLAMAGWLFDVMDQIIFTASRSITMSDLLPEASLTVQTQYGGYVTSLFIFGWATGGLIFGIMGDKWGRAKTMALTILVYAVFTGLSSLAKSWEVFGLLRFMTGLGVGGEFAVGAALVAEVMPQKARAQALGTLQAFSAFGNILGAYLFRWVEPIWGWEGLYVVGAVPALLAVVVRLSLKEPEQWVKSRAAAKEAQAQGKGVGLGKISELFTVPRWRKNTLVGLALGIAGIIGLWGVGFWTPELIDSTIPTVSAEARSQITGVLDSPSGTRGAAYRRLEGESQEKLDELWRRAARGRPDTAAEAGLEDAAAVEGVRTLLAKSLAHEDKTRLKSTGLILQQISAFLGMFTFSVLAARIGRRPTFLLSFLIGWASIIIVFLGFREASDIYYLWPILGFGTLMPFAGYAIYFPELFPTRLRTTGTGFCYNVSRYAAIGAPIALGSLNSLFYERFGDFGFRIAAIVVASPYLIGIIALKWAPETLNRPLPEDESTELAQPELSGRKQ